MDWKNKIINKFSETKRFVLFVYNHFFDDDCSYRASALAFTSLLAIVPLMSVSLAILSSFPVFHDLSNPIQNFIFENFVPTTGKVIQTYLQQFTAQVSRLSLWGILFLFVTALLLMVTIERSMNKIWRANARRGVDAFLLYWAILSLAPVLVGFSLVASSYLISIPFFQANKAPSFLLNSLPLLFSLIGFTFLYVVVPNHPVKILHGLIGGLTATLLFEAAKQSFAFYLSRYNSYELLYGAFATIPIFFVWIYWVWLITLLGAEISYALSMHHQRRLGAPLNGFSHALLWLYHLWLKQRKGQAISLNELIEASDRPYEVPGDDMIKVLKQLNLIQSNEKGKLLLSRDLNHVSLYWLSQNLPFNLPTQPELEAEASYSFPWHPVLKENNINLKQSLNINIEQLFIGA